jgi:exonuclease SbcC
MQLIERLRLHNYKCHRDLDLKFGPGVTGIVGDNGSGKSSIISAIRFLFTGEVDTKDKQKSITLGETEGWVSGQFNLNGKVGTLERHLNSSTVKLRYDDVPYNKAGEVKELWNRLLQIDSSIFNNVIIAAQGDIKLLFCGDSSIREKIFQKIFLVPPTDKLRSTIWDHYIKTCPPERFEEDVTSLQSQQAEIATKRNALLAEIDTKTSNVMNEAFQKCVIERIAFLERCKRDLEVQPGLESQLTQLDADIDQLEYYIQEEEKELAKVDYEDFRRTHGELLSQKQLAVHKEELLCELAIVEAKAPTQEEWADIKVSLDQVNKEEQDAQEQLTIATTNQKFYAEQIEFLAQFKDSACCPTCSQPIQDVSDTLERYKEQKAEADREVMTLNAKHSLASKKGQRLRNTKSLMDGQWQRLSALQQQLARLSDVEYSAEDLKVLEAALREYETRQKNIQNNKNALVQLRANKEVLQEKIKNLAVYDGEDSIEVELATMNEVIRENQRRLSELETTKVEQAKHERDLELLETRIETSLENHKFNVKRQEYLAKLNKSYEILHVQKFPRMLIQSYAEHVQVYLSNYLEKFTIPYRGKIVDGFRIVMIDAEDRELPMISGGQEMIVGLCLRLALHKMFAQSFPLWIVDEGTTHLSEPNRKAYFKLIEEIRTKKLVDQVLIIDHDNQLSTVVDNTIQL